MRVAPLLLTGAFLGACTDAQPDSARFACHSLTARVFFWPDGHPANRSIGAPLVEAAHVEVAVATTIDEAFFFDFAGSANRGTAACDESMGSAPAGSIDGAREVLDAAYLICELPEDGILWRTPPSTVPASVTIASGDAVFARVTLEPDGSRLAYRSDGCRVEPPPI